MSDAALQANAVAAANTAAPSSPSTKIRRCPYRSPALPNDGPSTPKASIGPVIDQETAAWSEPRSRAMPGRETASSVMVTETVKRPVRITASTAHRWAGPSGRPIGPSRERSERERRRPSRRGHGTTPTSSTPAGSTVVTPLPAGCNAIAASTAGRPLSMRPSTG